LTEPTFWSRFRNVDADDAATLTAYLDAYNALPVVAAGKRRSLALAGAADGAAILDVGCGTGEETRALRALVGPSGRAVGVDASEHLIAEARARAEASGAPGEYVVADAAALPFADDEFDGCRCDRTLQHLEAPAQALVEMLRVVRPSGRLVVTETGNALEGEPTADAGLLARARERFAPMGPKEGWFGAFVPLLLSRAGVLDVAIEEQRDELSDFASVCRALNLDAALDALVGAGDCTREPAEALLAGLREDVESGRVRAVIRVLHFHGAVPGGP
jgi:ubiquinone/menaquinone biosynthesis C-methylase UbiE